MVLLVRWSCSICVLCQALVWCGFSHSGGPKCKSHPSAKACSCSCVGFATKFQESRVWDDAEWKPALIRGAGSETGGSSKS